MRDEAYRELVEPMFPGHGKAAVVLKPSEQRFDLPPAAVAREDSALAARPKGAPRLSRGR